MTFLYSFFLFKYNYTFLLHIHHDHSNKQDNTNGLDRLLSLAPFKKHIWQHFIVTHKEYEPAHSCLAWWIILLCVCTSIMGTPKQNNLAIMALWQMSELGQKPTHFPTKTSISTPHFTEHISDLQEIVFSSAECKHEHWQTHAHTHRKV